jgi:hypothetical protein
MRLLFAFPASVGWMFAPTAQVRLPQKRVFIIRRLVGFLRRIDFIEGNSRGPLFSLD